MAIGYTEAKNLMRQLGWKMRAVVDESGVREMAVFHPLQDNEFKLREATGRNLLRECRVECRPDRHTVILEYNRTEEDVYIQKWFAVTRWSAEDVVAAAKAKGVHMTEQQAVDWWRKNESAFRDTITQYGNEILADMNFEEDNENE